MMILRKTNRWAHRLQRKDALIVAISLLIWDLMASKFPHASKEKLKMVSGENLKKDLLPPTGLLLLRDPAAQLPPLIRSWPLLLPWLGMQRMRLYLVRCFPKVSFYLNYRLYSLNVSGIKSLLLSAGRTAIAITLANIWAARPWTPDINSLFPTGCIILSTFRKDARTKLPVWRQERQWLRTP